jgi:hypothetical protein
MAKGTVRVRLVLADGGAFHEAEVDVPVASLEGYDRLIDCLREDPQVLKQVHVDADRLAAAYQVRQGS